MVTKRIGSMGVDMRTQARIGALTRGGSCQVIAAVLAASGALDANAQNVAATDLQSITVTAEKATPAGGGLMESEVAPEVVETISRSYIDLQSPTSNPLLLMANLPSVNISTVDAFGLNGGGNAQIHGLSTNDLGWILDGVPVYSQGAGFSNEMIAVQDLETLTVSPGSSNLSDPTISSAAGTIYLSMRDPAKTPGGFIEADFGSDQLNKEFIRLDSGDIANTGARAFISFAHAFVNNWRGAGSTDQKHLDSKIVEEWDDGSRLAFEVSANQQYYGYYYFPTAGQFANYKADSSQFNTNKVYGGIDDTSFYKLNMQNPFNFLSLQLPGKLVVNEHLSVSDTPYLWLGVGGGTGATDLTQGQTFQGTANVPVDLTDGGKIPLTNGQVLANTGFAETTVQAGNTLKARLTFGDNAVVLGWWYEHETQNEADAIGIVNQATGVPYSADITGYLKSGSKYIISSTGQPYYANHSNQGYSNNTVFLGDTLSLLNEKLALTAGIKEAFVSEFGNNLVPGSPPHIGFSQSVPLPQASASYEIDARNQVFAHVERDYRLPYTFSLVGNYGVTSGALLTGAVAPKPETALKEEVGYRYHGDLILADVSFFNIHLSNRLLTLNSLINGNPVGETQNAGGQTSRGVDGQIATIPLFGHFSPSFTFEYLDAKITTNTPDVNVNGDPDFLPTKGKTQVQSPEFQSSVGLTYTNGPFSGGVRVRYVASQYSTLMNDEKEPGFATDDLSMSYQLPAYQLPALTNKIAPKIQLNLYNLTNTLARSGVYQFQYNAKDATGTSGNLISASGSPTYYVEPKFAAVLSISTPF